MITIINIILNKIKFNSYLLLKLLDLSEADKKTMFDCVILKIVHLRGVFVFQQIYCNHVPKKKIIVHCKYTIGFYIFYPTENYIILTYVSYDIMSGTQIWDDSLYIF